MRVVGCFLEYDNKLLLLHRHSHKPYGNTWGTPSGKIDPGESDDDAIIRELFEETGYKADKPELEPLGVFPCPPPSGETTDWVVYRIRLQRPHQVVVAEAEHSGFKWVTPQECYELPDLIYGVRDVLKEVGYNIGDSNLNS